MKSRFLLFVLLSLPATCFAAEEMFDIKPVADGVYAAIAKPAYKVNCNAAIIFLGDSVLVVDTHSKPSAARALIEQIKKLTPRPVRYVVNTHFHWDHYQGNEAYPSSWPAGVEIISSEATRANIERIGIPRIKNEIVSMPQEIANLKRDLERASAAEQKSAIQENIRQPAARRENGGDLVARPRAHRWRCVRLPSQGKSAGDRRCSARVDSVYGRQLSV